MPEEFQSGEVIPKIDVKEFRVRAGQKVDLNKWPTYREPFYESDRQYKQLLREGAEELSAPQRLLYASNSYALLLIFQAMDTGARTARSATVIACGFDRANPLIQFELRGEAVGFCAF